MDKSRYSGEIRVRSCGILIEEGKILLINLHSPVTDELIWIPPGGKVDFGESLREAVQREFTEETGLKVTVKDLLHVKELIDNGIHAIEFYYQVERTGGNLSLGKDPEVFDQDQIIQDLKFFTKDDLKDLNIVPAFITDDLWKLSRPELVIHRMREVMLRSTFVKLDLD
ncbi:NUDIX domain-containing protein [Rhodohalobacter sp.]|uniref:NUDIX domain-containing protein n=1 Tax=Rhodohalobacter sp. TaxID=1974210 RepID=UPI002ACDC134|nr:NUDIX domain-containing protein [Rhodohalobacter sp.]MDZ7756389.1 NUDIX domain-containing protein [Rhodohalobacter sp.]